MGHPALWPVRQRHRLRGRHFLVSVRSGNDRTTAHAVLPVLVWAMAQNLDRRNRAHRLVTSAFAGFQLMALYPLLALFKGELLPDVGCSSLISGRALASLVARVRGWEGPGRASGRVLHVALPQLCSEG